MVSHLQSLMSCVVAQTGEAARLRMVKSNERLVWHVARKYQNRGLDIEDLIAEGMNGLLKGVNKFDPNKGFKFSTYAHWWVRQSITRAISEQVIFTDDTQHWRVGIRMAVLVLSITLCLPLLLLFGK